VFAGLFMARHGVGVVRERAFAGLLAGFACPWVPWAAWVAIGWSDYLGQMRIDAARFDLLNPRFYVDNVLHADGPISLQWSVRAVRTLSLVRVGTWTMLLGLPAACAAIAWDARRHGREAVSSLAVASLALAVMFVALLKVKHTGYMIALWPLGVLLLAWFGIWLWDRGRFIVRAALVALLALIVVEGTTRVAHAWNNARQTTPYGWYEAEVASCIPPGSLVLGLQHYWLGLRQYPYRTWLLPIDLANPLYYHEPMSLDQALERVNPTVVLVDRYIDDLMTKAADSGDPNHQLYVGFEAFKARRYVKLTCVIRDHTYGTMQVYWVPKTPAPNSGT